MKDHLQPNGVPDPDGLSDPDGAVSRTMGSSTAKYLDDRAAESFKRQTELEESVWRSLPLFTGGLLAAGAIVTNAAAALPPFGWRVYTVCAFGVLGLATMAFVVAFWWLWQVVKPRDFDYPADDEAIARYASDMIAFHAGQGLHSQALDDEVTRELRLYMATTFATAAKSTLANNQIRLSARSQVLVFLLSGFSLAFACDTIIFSHRLVYGTDTGGSDRGAEASRSEQQSRHSEAGAPVAAADARDPGRRVADENQHGAANPEQVSGGRRKAGRLGIGTKAHAGGAAGAPGDAEADQDIPG